MDKKNVLIGLAFILAAFGLMFYQSSQMEPVPVEPETPVEEALPSSSDTDSGTDLGSLEGEETAPVADGSGEEPVFQPVAPEVVAEEEETASVEEVTRSLANEFIDVQFTSRGGGIKQVHFLQTKRGGMDTFVFNADTRLPALGVSIRGPDSEYSFSRNYSILEDETNQTQIVFERELVSNIFVRRVFSISSPGEEGVDPYLIRHKTTFINRSEQPLESGDGAYLNLGTVYSIGPDTRGEFLAFGYFDGEDAEFIRSRKFTGSSGFLGIGASAPVSSVSESRNDLNVVWGSVKNQFFAFVATVGEGVRSNGFFATGSSVIPPNPPDAPPADAIRASLAFPLERIEPGESLDIAIDFYAGPKEFRRLTQLGEKQDEVMQFGFLSFFSKILLSFLYAIHTVVPSWGWSIVVMTIIIKLIFWPLTAKATQSQKRMQKIQAPLKELREQYKDNPQKMQKETMKLFRENKVNPAAGCLPILIQMPIFIGLFWMLRTASELRYAPFLWIDDLSRPDTVAVVFGLPINILPLIMGVTMFFQMRMTPAMANADPLQQKIFKFLPFVFLVILYNFSSGLVLYWTVQNLLTILQQYITNKRSDVANEPVVIPSSAKKKAKKSTGKK
ncbi:MAG: YidC/Oxa1 family insertase periplasmic-domain containing protein [Verrucomicrobiota bacterium]